MARWTPPWLESYDRADLRGDLAAGLTVAVMLVPQGMAYAMLAGLPPVVGLYASILPLIAYAALGSSRQLAVGPVAMVSLLVASGVSGLADPGTPEFLGYALLLALMVGALQMGMGLFRLGALVRFLTHPVVSGFTSAAAILIAASQLKSLLGLSLPRTAHFHELLLSVAEHAGEIHLPTVIVGGVAIATLIAVRREAPRLPGALIVVAVGTLAVWMWDPGVAIVGAVPSGLPVPTAPVLEWNSFVALIPTALVISLVGFMESIAVARSLARRHGYHIDANRELLGLGAANIAAAFTGGYPVTGGFSRSAVNDQAGARTPMAAVVTAGLIAATVLFLTPLFHWLPKAVLGAIIVVAVLGLVDLAEFRRLSRDDRPQAALLALTFMATLFLGIEIGIMLGVAASFVVGKISQVLAPPESAVSDRRARA